VNTFAEDFQIYEGGRNSGHHLKGDIMKYTKHRPKAYSTNRARHGLQLIVLICLLGMIAQADIANVGALSYDTFIPAGNGSPGVFAFDIYNLTGAFSLPPDFQVTDSLTFGAATLTLTRSDLSQEVFDLGNIGPGYLSDQNGNPIIQVPGNGLFDSAEFTATLSTLTFAQSGGAAVHGQFEFD